VSSTKLLTGEKAFPGENYFSIMYKITNEEPVPVRKLRPDLPEILAKITAKASPKTPACAIRRAWISPIDLRWPSGA